MFINERYRVLSQRFSDVVADVADDGWGSPSPCAEWTALDIVHHVVTTEAEFLTRIGFDDTPTFATIDASDRDAVLSAWPKVREAVQRAIDDPQHAAHPFDGYFGPTTFADTLGTFYCGDLSVHRWDLRRASGHDARDELSADEIADLNEAFGPQSPLAAVLRQPGLFDDAVEVPGDATPTEKMMGWLGRTP
jgi:uncharacterized protein (TIGR03086 family)